MGIGRGPWTRPLIALGAGLALLLVGLPWVLGALAQGAYQELLRELLSSLPPGSVQSEHYERGWFCSRATMELSLSPPHESGGGPPLHLRIDSRIEQGPLHWLSSGLPPALARIHSRVEPADHPGEPPPLLLTTDLYPGGSARSKILLPAGKSPIPRSTYRLDHSELAGSLRFEPSAHTLKLDLDLSELELATPAGPVATIADLRLTSELRTPPQRARDATPRSNGESAVDAARTGPGDLARGRVGARPGSPRYPLPGPVDLRLQIAAEALTLADQTYRQARLGVSAERLDAAALSDLVNALETISSGTVPRAMRGLLGAALLAEVLPRIAATEPRISIEPVRMDTPDGALSAQLNVMIAPGANKGGNPGARLPRGTDWIAALQADGEIDLPEPLARRWLVGSGSGTKAAPGPSQLQKWLDGGWIAIREGRVTSAFHLADGLLTVNGKTLPLSGLPSVRLQ